MKKFRFIPIMGIIVFIVLGIVGCVKNTVESIFDKDWTSMSKEDKKALENYFKNQGYDNPQNYWDLCADEGADTAGRMANTTIGSRVARATRVKAFEG